MNRQQKIRLLVKNILSQNTQKADKLLQSIIAEAQEEREEQAKDEAEEELGVTADEDEPTEETPEQDETQEEFDQSELDQDEFSEFDTNQNNEQEGQDEFGPDSEQEQLANDSEISDLVDKQVNFEVQINNLVLNDLQNKVADLKTALENDTTLDRHSREFYEIQVPLQYYAQKLSEMKKNVSPLINQDDIKKQLDEISISLQELFNKINNGEDEGIKTPNEVIEKDLGKEF